MPAYATGPQVALISRLVAERTPSSFPAPLVSMLVLVTNGTATKQQASWAIENLFKVPKAEAAPRSNERPADLGYYLVDETVYVVVASKSSGKHYAKRMSVVGARGRWEYAHGMVYHLAGAHRLTVEEARVLGRSLGCCMICGATLTDPESVERGIGPICEQRVAGTYSPRRSSRQSSASRVAVTADDLAPEPDPFDDGPSQALPYTTTASVGAFRSNPSRETRMVVNCPGCEFCDGEGGTHSDLRYEEHSF